MLITDLAYLDELSRIRDIVGGEMQYQIFYSPSFKVEDVQKMFTVSSSSGVTVSYILDPSLENGFVIKGTGNSVGQSYTVSGTLTGENQSTSFYLSSSVLVS